MKFSLFLLCICIALAGLGQTPAERHQGGKLPPGDTASKPMSGKRSIHYRYHTVYKYDTLHCMYKAGYGDTVTQMEGYVITRTAHIESRIMEYDSVTKKEYYSYGASDLTKHPDKVTHLYLDRYKKILPSTYRVWGITRVVR